jgi:hypothetical protein
MIDLKNTKGLKQLDMMLRNEIDFGLFFDFARDLDIDELRKLLAVAVGRLKYHEDLDRARSAYVAFNASAAAAAVLKGGA